jgi:hypothetical protein
LEQNTISGHRVNNSGPRIAARTARDNEQRNVSYDIHTWIPHHSYTVEHP